MLSLLQTPCTTNSLALSFFSNGATSPSSDVIESRISLRTRMRPRSRSSDASASNAWLVPPLVENSANPKNQCQLFDSQSSGRGALQEECEQRRNGYTLMRAGARPRGVGLRGRIQLLIRLTCWPLMPTGNTVPRFLSFLFQVCRSTIDILALTFRASLPWRIVH